MKSFAVIGLGRFGQAVAMKLFDMGYEVLAIDKEQENVDAIADCVTQAVCADLMEAGVMNELGLKDYDTVVVGIGNNLSDSILITMQLKEQGVKEVIAKAQDANHRKVLQKVGADRVVIPEQEEGIKMAMQLVSENVFDFIEISPKYSIVDVKIPKSWTGKTLVQLNLRRNYGVNVIAVKERVSGAVKTISPNAEHALSEDDIIVVIGENSMIEAINNIK